MGVSSDDNALLERWHRLTAQHAAARGAQSRKASKEETTRVARSGDKDFDLVAILRRHGRHGSVKKPHPSAGDAASAADPARLQNLKRSG